jgi:DNA (cytosine-5)-methyltransferase 1
MTVMGGSKMRGRAWLDQGRVVQMTPRALARFQTWPDWYPMPSTISLACTIVGNGVPVLMARLLIEGMLEAIS